MNLMRGFSLLKKIPVTSFFIVDDQYRVGEISEEEDEVIQHRSLAFPEQPGEFFMGRYGIHVPLCNVQADDDAGDVSYRITDAVI